MSVCFSKGLGAPVGSALVGDRQLIEKAHRRRKMLGGGMRQAGMLAAAADYALQNHIERLDEDHQHAKSLAAGLAGIEGIELIQNEPDTNIVLFQVDPQITTAANLVEQLACDGVRMLAVAPQRVRAVTHLDVPHAQVGDAVQFLKNFFLRLRNP